MRARRARPGATESFTPAPIEEVVAAIHREKPSVVCAPHVETSAGMILPDAYIKAVTAATHANGGIFVLDCVASGCLWVDMAALGVDALVTAPQKGWSGTPAFGIVMLGPRAVERLKHTNSSAFCVDLKKWYTIMRGYVEKGVSMYHVTVPTDAIVHFAKIMKETENYGFRKCYEEQVELGRQIRALVESKGYRSVAGDGFKVSFLSPSFHHDALISDMTMKSHTEVFAKLPRSLMHVNDILFA